MSEEHLEAVESEFLSGPDCSVCGAKVTPKEVMDEHEPMCSTIGSLETKIKSLKTSLSQERKKAASLAAELKAAKLYRAEVGVIGKQLGCGYEENTVSVMVQVMDLQKRLAEAESSLSKTLARESKLRNEIHLVIQKMLNESGEATPAIKDLAEAMTRRLPVTEKR